MKVFLSYSSADREAASQIADHLSREGHNVWVADDALRPGDNWSLEIGKALANSEAMIILLSPDSVRSERVRQELEFALVSKRYAHKVIPILIKTAKGIPWILKKLQIVDAREDVDGAVRPVVERLDKLANADPAPAH
jgi:hypothetical protein